MSLADVLAIVGIITTIAVAVVAIVVSVKLYWMQRDQGAAQGERLGLMMLSAVRTMQRRLPYQPVVDDEYEPEPWEFSIGADIEPVAGFVKRGQTVTLKLTVNDPQYSGAFKCEVVSPTRVIYRSELAGGELISRSFPTDFPGADTDTAGIYWVEWRELESWSVGEKHYERFRHSIDTSFAVLP